MHELSTECIQMKEADTGKIKRERKNLMESLDAIAHARARTRECSPRTVDIRFHLGDHSPGHKSVLSAQKCPRSCGEDRVCARTREVQPIGRSVDRPSERTCSGRTRAIHGFTRVRGDDAKACRCPLRCPALCCRTLRCSLRSEVSPAIKLVSYWQRCLDASSRAEYNMGIVLFVVVTVVLPHRVVTSLSRTFFRDVKRISCREEKLESENAREKEVELAINIGVQGSRLVRGKVLTLARRRSWNDDVESKKLTVGRVVRCPTTDSETTILSVTRRLLSYFTMCFV